MERIIKSGVLDSRGANFANYIPYFSKPKKKDLMCEEDTWNVKEKDGRSYFGSFSSNKVKNIEEKSFSD